MEDKALTDIAEALKALRSAFVKHGIPVPDEIGYSDPVQGKQVKMMLQSAKSDFVTFDIQAAQPWKSETMEIVGFKVNT